jgi:hypothetical protein
MTNEVSNGVLQEVPDDTIQALKADAGILERWNKLTPIQRNE